MVSLGLTRFSRVEQGLREVVHTDEGRALYRKLIFRGERLVGALLVG
ncbi:MAG: hypothetical protein M1325_01320, partial [Actinobacteria bacterium]|nr:hypothetical protein [Actinomycetota bacterium]